MHHMTEKKCLKTEKVKQESISIHSWHSWVDTGVLGLGGIRTGAVASGPCGCSLHTGPGRGTEAAVLFKIVQNDVDFSVCIQGEQRCDISLKAKDAELV